MNFDLFTQYGLTEKYLSYGYACIKQTYRLYQPGIHFEIYSDFQFGKSQSKTEPRDHWETINYYKEESQLILVNLH